MSGKQNLAIVGIFYDGYYDLWEDFLELKERYWKDCPYPLYIVNQTKELNFSKKYEVTVLHAGEDAEYSRKVQTALKEIKADYYLLLLDDFFFSRKLSGSVLDDRLSFMKDNNLFYYCMPLKEFAKTWTGTKYHNNDSILNMRGAAEYTVNCQPSIWERTFLEKCIGNGNYNAWVFEGIYIKSKIAHTDSFLSHCKVDVSNLLSLRHGALQGKLLPSTVSYFESEGYRMKNKRPLLDKKSFRIDELKNFIKTYMPLRLQKIFKSILKSESVIDRYQDDIISEMRNLGVE